MRNFVHHNPLHSLEYLSFEETLRRGRRFLGGNGYLPNEIFRAYVRSGRIRPEHIDAALKPRVHDKHVNLGDRRITHGEVLRACLVQGIGDPAGDTLAPLMDRGPEPYLVDVLAERLIAALKPQDMRERIQAGVQEDLTGLGRHVMLSSWCDRTLGTQIVNLINGELIKWCEAFLDEGHATWPMPGRDKDFYGAWKFLAGQEWSPCEIPDSRQKIARLPDHPEDAVLESLAALAIPSEFWQDYLALQLAALPGWAGFIKWRSEQTAYEWQQAYPIGLVKFLAVRLWYVRELVQKVCREELGIEGNYSAISTYMQSHPRAYFLMRERVAGRLPAAYADKTDQIWHGARHRREAWETLADRYQAECGLSHNQAVRRVAARRLLALTKALDIVPAVLMDTSPQDLAVLLDWMKAFPESEHGPIWLNAFEAGYQEELFGKLMPNVSRQRPSVRESVPRPRPHAQAVFCIDVRSEPFRRHLEASGDYETFGFAGFFAVFIRYRAWGSDHETEQFPVIMRAKMRCVRFPEPIWRSFFPSTGQEPSWSTRGIHSCTI